jgi:hypothetical protein
MPGSLTLINALSRTVRAPAITNVQGRLRLSVATEYPSRIIVEVRWAGKWLKLRARSDRCQLEAKDSARHELR